ncbi:hypothetical protein FSP39_004985 [Pinctada imbricata]|uniref:C2H2-type domain-containing protein n=1 Tax=Pinctada imbricata TaxID=66713 RepID=A0AA89C4V3_PINIB|nr:hypothetical protein FSP39_004985 [Pinctada imbricata]
MEMEDVGIVKEECLPTNSSRQDKIQEFVTSICVRQSQCAILYWDEGHDQVEHYGTTLGRKFLLDHRDVTQQFLGYCYAGRIPVVDTQDRKAGRDTSSEVTGKKRSNTTEDTDSDVICDKRRKLSVSSDDVEDDDYSPLEVTTPEVGIPDVSLTMTDARGGDDGQAIKSKFPKILLGGVEENDHVGYVRTPERRVTGRRKSSLKFKELMASMTKSNDKKKSSIDKDADSEEKKTSGNDAGEMLAESQESLQSSQSDGAKKSSGKLARSTGRKSVKTPTRSSTDINAPRTSSLEKGDDSQRDLDDVVTRSGRRVTRKLSMQIKQELEEIIDEENDENWETLDEEEENDDSGKKRKRNSTSVTKKKKSKKLSGKVVNTKMEPKCLECHEEFKNLGMLSSHLSATGHLQICNYETDYRCFTCNLYFRRMFDLKMHMERTSHTGNAAHESMREVMVVNPRKKNRKTLSKFKCSMCKADYRLRENCEEHVRLGTCVAKYYKKCPCCKENFRNKNLLHVHLKKKHRDEYPFRCPNCHLTFNHKRDLETHKKIHRKANYLGAALEAQKKTDCLGDGDRKEEGQVVGIKEETETEKNMEGKMLENDNIGVVAEVENPTLQDIFTENIHPYLRLKYIKKIQRQLRGVADDDTAASSDDLDCEQTCIVCSEKFTTYGRLRIHIRSTYHEQVTEEPTGYKCYTCNKFFVKLADLEGHMEMTSHTGNPEWLQHVKQVLKIEKKNPERVYQQYKCSLCGMEFSTLQKCEFHVENSTCAKNYRKKCECCELCFSKKNLYHVHMYQKHRFEYPFRCMRCDLEFDTMTCYLSHLRSHLKGIPLNASENHSLEDSEKFSCNSCAKKFLTKYQLMLHYRHEHPEQVDETEKEVNLVGSTEVSDYKCYDCDLYFSNLLSLQHHGKLLGHTGNQILSEAPTVLRIANKESTSKNKLKPFKCSRCQDRFASKNVAERHVAKNYCQQYWRRTCPFCAVIFRFRNMYEAHMLQFHKHEYPFKCENCDRIFYRASAYNSHRVNIHGREPFRPHPEGLVEVISCKICSKMFRGRGNFNQHMLAHHGDTAKPFICEQCGARFSSQRSMREHVINTHERDPNNPELKCHVCHKVLKSVKSRILHEKLMHGDGQCHTCEICGFTTKRLGNLNYHIAQKHSDEPAYTCNECGLKIRVKPSYNLHMANHALDRGDIETAQTYCKIHQCDICQRGFSTKQKCEKHKIKHLGDHGKLNCKICGIAIACYTGGLRKHYRLQHALGPKEAKSLMKDIPSAAEFLEKMREYLNDEVPVPVVPMEERKSTLAVQKKKKNKKLTASMKAELNDEESLDALDYESEDNYEEYLVLPGASNSPRKPAAPERDFLAEAMSQIQVIENTYIPPAAGTQSEVVVETVSNTEEIELIIPQGGTQLLIRDETGQLVKPQFITTSEENGAGQNQDSKINFTE